MAGTKRPNVLLVTLDQFRGRCLSVAGHPVVKTPHLDRLAGDGVRFAQHWAQCAPCGPSRASLLTGLYMCNHRSVFNGTPLDDRIPNLARMARATGYDPVLFGYTDTTVDVRTVDDPNDPRLRNWEGLLPGFRVGVQLDEAAAPWVEWLREEGVEFDDPSELAVGRSDHPGAAERGSTWAPAVFDAEHTETAFLTGRAMEWIEAEASDEEPWFVHISHLRPHPPFVAPEPYHDLYDPDEVPDPVRAATLEEEGALHPFLALATSFMGVDPDEREMRQLRATYYGMISEVDAQMGRLLGWLDDTGRAENTLVIVTSDHGEQLGDHWLVQKLGFFDESYHVPLIIRAPFLEAADAAAAGTVVQAFTENVDIVPTICELASIPPPAHLDGRSLAGFLTNRPPDDWRTEVHWEFDFRAVVGDPTQFGLTLEDCHLQVLRDAHGKYVHFPVLGSLLLDLDADPTELTNVGDDPAHAARVLDYAQRMLDWRMRHEDSTLANILVGPSGPEDLRRRIG